MQIIKQFKLKYENKEEIENKIKDEITNFIKQINNKEKIINCFNQYYYLLYFLINQNEKIEKKDLIKKISNIFIKNIEFLIMILDLLKIENFYLCLN